MTFVDETGLAGLTQDQIRQRVRSGEWRSLVRGAYLPEGESVFAGQDEHARRRTEHALRAIAAARRNPGSVVTDASAALIHGLPVARLPAHVQLAVPPGRWTGTRSGVDFRTRDFRPEEIVSGRVPVASVTRCWMDIGRLSTLGDALVSGDAALRLGLLDTDSIACDLDRWRNQRGCRRLFRALDLIDGVRETPLESMSFAYFVEHLVPLPRHQVEIRTYRGGFIARVDFLWDEIRLVGEADGKLKYRTQDELYAEKRREDQIRGEGYQVVRWGWSDLQGDALARRLRRLVAVETCTFRHNRRVL